MEDQGIKDHQIAQLVNKLNKKVRVICPDAPQQLRECIRTAVVQYFHEHEWERSLENGKCFCQCGAFKDIKCTKFTN